MKITSPSFGHKEKMPPRFTCKGEDINPALRIGEVPFKTESLALIVDDPDAPAKIWVHWLVCNMPKDCQVAENSVPGIEGQNDSGEVGYSGPCPPSGTHRYFFRLYALDARLTLKKGYSRTDLEKAMEGHVLAQTELVGLFAK